MSDCTGFGVLPMLSKRRFFRLSLIVSVFTFRDAETTIFEKGSRCNGIRGEGKRALVTGITGMIGSHIAETLVEHGYDVYGFVRPRSPMRNLANILSNITLVSGELTDPWRTLKVIQKLRPDRIFHFAAQAFNGLSYDDPEYTLDTNLKTTLNLLEAVRQAELTHSTRILIAGSSTVYGASTEEANGSISEDAPMKPVSPYGVSKAATELLAMQYARTHGLYVVIPRIFIHLAPRGVEALALHEFSRQIAMIERGLQEPVIQHGDISTLRDITDVRDSAPVFMCLPEVALSGTVVNVGSSQTYSIKQLLDLAVEKSTMNNVIKFALDSTRLRLYDEKIVVADIIRLQNLTGWSPQPDLPGLVDALLTYWRSEIDYRYPKIDVATERKSEL
eukprot:TRINITY_DN77218_c0_g1_i1.p1 TRINITY_DN77218_c0_g1~~TRINITY_DN77218_c0_g1_i1.p1  ORF type:complete len:398 (+),score=45.55 TRINITY_DN77218_c0_g1_i1:27-1196(+)